MRRVRSSDHPATHGDPGTTARAAGIVALAVLALAYSSGGQPAANGADKPASRPTTAEAANTWTGTLQGGVAGIGGETTGWRLVGDGQTGGMDVDVSRVQKDAAANDGKWVTITGRLVTKDWVERGRVQVIVAERIAPAAGRKKDKPE